MEREKDFREFREKMNERILGEGGYEGRDAMVYYDKPARFAPGIENRIVQAVKEQLPATFSPQRKPAPATRPPPARTSPPRVWSAGSRRRLCYN